MTENLGIPSVSVSTTSEDESTLHYMTAALFATILEGTILRLNIIDQCNNELRVKMATQRMGSLLAIKYDIKPSTEPENFVTYTLNCDENKLEKMDNDRKLCMDVQKKLYQELCSCNTFTHLQKFIQQRTTEEGHPFVKEVNERKLHYRQLKHRLRSQRNVHRSGMYDSEEYIGKLQELLNDTEQQNEVQTRYMVTWKNALTEQHAQRIHNSENKFMSSIRRYKKKQDRETRAHDEVERFNTIIMRESVNKVEEIMEKYDEGIETFDLKFQIAMSRLAEVQQKRKDMEKKLASRQKEIDAWYEYTKERAAKQALEKRKNDAAEIVQAWWRGILVRKKLGPFRAKKSKPENKKKGRK